MAQHRQGFKEEPSSADSVSCFWHLMNFLTFLLFVFLPYLDLHCILDAGSPGPHESTIVCGL